MNEKRVNVKRELCAAVVRAAEAFYKDQSNIEAFKLWGEARKREKEKEAKRAC